MLVKFCCQIQCFSSLENYLGRLNLKQGTRAFINGSRGIVGGGGIISCMRTFQLKGKSLQSKFLHRYKLNHYQGTGDKTRGI
jgi:uncharacterized protein (DUF39 family)